MSRGHARVVDADGAIAETARPTPTGGGAFVLAAQKASQPPGAVRATHLLHPRPNCPVSILVSETRQSGIPKLVDPIAPRAILVVLSEPF